MTITLRGVAPMEAFGETLAPRLRAALPPDRALVVWLEGDLGSGKTTLARGIVRGLGGAGPVRSPTYSLLETYAVPGVEVVHLDLYRLDDAGELEMLGLRELERAGALWLVEWARPLADALPPADLAIGIDFCRGGRKLSLEAHSATGRQVLAAPT